MLNRAQVLLDHGGADGRVQKLKGFAPPQPTGRLEEPAFHRVRRTKHLEGKVKKVKGPQDLFRIFLTQVSFSFCGQRKMKGIGQKLLADSEPLRGLGKPFKRQAAADEVDTGEPRVRAVRGRLINGGKEIADAQELGG